MEQKINENKKMVKLSESNISLKNQSWITWTNNYILPSCFNDVNSKFFQLISNQPFLNEQLIINHLTKLITRWSNKSQKKKVDSINFLL